MPHPASWGGRGSLGPGQPGAVPSPEPEPRSDSTWTQVLAVIQKYDKSTPSVLSGVVVFTKCVTKSRDMFSFQPKSFCVILKLIVDVCIFFMTVMKKIN